ncbi:MAG TPA: hypothetical protein VMB73_03895 [Acetobacteraceae bacterium]|jgi:hypothetical protein|nr:hypothetical protein [Acetobacteraceae bacterium]
MDTVEVTFHLEKPVAERLRDPGELARYEAFLGLVANATTEAEVADAVALFAGSPGMRQRNLMAAFADARRVAAEAGLTAEEVDEELEAWKREHRS